MVILTSIVSIGFMTLVYYWVPSLYIRIRYKKCSIEEATKLAILDDNGDIATVKLEREFIVNLNEKIYTYTF